jgi:hypothetical protein
MLCSAIRSNTQPIPKEIQIKAVLLSGLFTLLSMNVYAGTPIFAKGTGCGKALNSKFFRVDTFSTTADSFQVSKGDVFEITNITHLPNRDYCIKGEYIYATDGDNFLESIEANILSKKKS